MRKGAGALQPECARPGRYVELRGLLAGCLAGFPAAGGLAANLGHRLVVHLQFYRARVGGGVFDFERVGAGGREVDVVLDDDGRGAAKRHHGLRIRPLIRVGRRVAAIERPGRDFK